MNSEEIQEVTRISDIPCSESPDEVLKGIFYELRHPISSLKGSLTILQMPFDEGLKQDMVVLIQEVAESMEKLWFSAHNYLANCFEAEVNGSEDEILSLFKEGLEQFVAKLEEPINAIKDASAILKEATDENTRLKAMLCIYRFIGDIEGHRDTVRNHYIQASVEK